MDEKTPAGDATARPLKPARTALNVLALCFVLPMIGRGLGDSFTVFLKPISESFGWDRAEVVSVYSLTWLAGGLMAPLVGRLFDRSGPRLVYSLGLLLLGGSFLVASRAQALWQFQLSTGLCVGIGIALIGNVPNSILLGRWFGPRLPTAMAILYSATGAGILMLLPASQLLIDRIGWRDAYQMVRHRGAVHAGAAAVAAVADVRHRLAACGAEGGHRLRRQWLDAEERDAPPRLLGAVLDLLLHGRGDVRHHGADRRLPDRCRIPAVAGRHRLGIFRRGAVVRHARHIDAGWHHRPPAVGAVQLRRLDRRHHPALAAAILSELLAADAVLSSASAA